MDHRCLRIVKVLEHLQQMTVNELDADSTTLACRSGPRDILCARTTVSSNAAKSRTYPFSFACDPVGLRLRRAQLCAAQASPPSFFVFPRSVRALLSVVQPGLYRNLA